MLFTWKDININHWAVSQVLGSVDVLTHKAVKDSGDGVDNLGFFFFLLFATRPEAFRTIIDN